MENWDLLSATIGGVLIGLSATLTLMLHGRVTGISGILAQALSSGGSGGEAKFSYWFLAGLIAGGVPFALMGQEAFTSTIERSTPALIVAGLLVGFGTRLGSGCTSGHGVCGMSRLSPRSLAATLTFITVGAVTVYLVKSLFGGVL